MNLCAGEAVMRILVKQGPVLESVVSMMKRVWRDGQEALVHRGVVSVVGLVARVREGACS